MPLSPNFAWISGICTMREISSDRRRAMGSGRPVGATKPAHCVIAICGKPASVKVGTSGRAALRCGDVTASTRTLPLRCCANIGARPSTATGTWLATRSVEAWPPPL